MWVSLKLEYEETLLEIENCIVDTGSAKTAIDIDLVSFNYEKLGIIRRIYGVGGGIQEVVQQKTGKIILDNFELKDIDIEFGNLQEKLEINGFLGMDILGQFICNINPYQQTIEFDKLN